VAIEVIGLRAKTGEICGFLGLDGINKNNNHSRTSGNGSPFRQRYGQ